MVIKTERFSSAGDFAARSAKMVAQGASAGPTIVIPAGSCAQASGANELIRIAKREILNQNLSGKIRLRITGCHGFCQMEPSVLVEPSGTFYPRVEAKNMPRIVQAAAHNAVLTELLFVDPASNKRIQKQSDVPFFKKQVRTLISRNEKVDPIRLDSYLEIGGYSSFVKVVSSGDPSSVIASVKASGLRGRGGAGFPTGRKWELLAAQKSGRGKILVCNADEGDPGAYMDRSLLEGNPHSIIEGMLIGGFATGASEGVVYVRNEYPLAIKHLTIALQQARNAGLLGADILGTGFSFDISMVQGAGAFVCGEETALIHSIEGKMGEPRQRPPFPVQKGIDGKPTAINNVETWANIPVIIDIGADEFKKVGTEKSTGTKIFSLVGKVKYTGLVEIPMGMTIAEIVYDIGGGPVGDARIKAVQTGGPSGGCIPASQFSMPVDYDSLSKAGTIMGSGGMIVMDNKSCMIDVARYFMNFLKDESCGKCFSCRKGTQRLHELLDDVCSGTGTPDHMVLLEELASVVKDTTMCGLGQSVPNSVLSTLRYFREEYERHIKDNRCDAFVCKQLVGAPCQSACPVETEPWRYIALVEKGQYEEAYKVIREANPFPSVCARACDRKCEHRCNLGMREGESIAVRAMKRFVTDRVDPSVYKPLMRQEKNAVPAKIAVVGAGPAGLTAAHYLSLLGHSVTIFEAENEPGGMLTCSLPAYRMPKDLVRREIASLMNKNITLKCNQILGRDITLDSLSKEGYKAIFLAIGAHKSWRLELEGEDVEGVYPSIQFLKAFNLKGLELARGHVGIIGGGNSAVDAARVALRQKQVTSVTLFYRRTRDEMPAYEEEVEAALEEGVRIETLVSPVKLHVRQEEINTAIREGVELETLVSPVKIISKEGRVSGIELIRNRLGEVDISGRRKPVPVPGTEFIVQLDTLIAAIGERPDSDGFAAMGLQVDKSGRVAADAKTHATNMKGVFAGGDLMTGPNTIIDAIASGKKVARCIQNYLSGKPLVEPAKPNLPKVFIEPAIVSEEEILKAIRATPPQLPVEKRRKNFNEIEMPLSEDQARAEARRCLRCDLAFTQVTSQLHTVAAVENSK